MLFFTARCFTDVYLAIGIMGFGTGFWAVFVTIGAENFWDNLGSAKRPFPTWSEVHSMASQRFFLFKSAFILR